ncbi:MAG TPA: ATP-binding cassette domain-containing protein [Acidothermaceae bacterium]|jgi:zinc/manganese transport system ATP-binding protein
MTAVRPREDAGAGRVALRLRGASVEVGGRELWCGVELAVESGQFVAILGANGAGKSTLVKAVLGLVELASGEIEVLGRPAGLANREIGYLPQRRTFDPSVRVRGVDVVRLGLDGDRWGFALPWGDGARQARRRVREVLELVGATSYAQRPIGHVSGGEQQRLLIAQALVRKPKMLILDEPLDSLDLPNQSSIAALIKRVCREQGVTVLMVAHDVNPILPYLDQVVYLAGGSVMCGAPRDVITSENLTKLYRSPIEVLRATDGRLVVVGEPEAPAHHADRHAHAPDAHR